MNIADMDFLTPGSVFTREDGREARFLFLTNTALSNKIKKRFPPQVVYADEHNNVLSCDIDRFLNTRKFVNVDPELEDRLVNLLALSSSGQEDSLDLDEDDSLTIDDGNAEHFELSEEPEDAEQDSQLVAAVSKVVDEDIDSEKPIVTFVASRDDLPVVIDATQLAQAVASYQQGPSLHDNSVQHILFIRKEEGISSQTLYNVFSPTHADRNMTYEFKVELDGQQQTIDWDTFVGIYPAVFFGSQMYQVIFSAPVLSVEMRAAVAAQVTEITPAVVEVVQQMADIPETVEVVEAAPAVQIQPAVQVQVQAQA